MTVSPKHTDFREKFTVERCRLHFVAAKQAGIGHAGRVNSSYVPNWPFCGRKRSSVRCRNWYAVNFFRRSSKNEVPWTSAKTAHGQSNDYGYSKPMYCKQIKTTKKLEGHLNNYSKTFCVSFFRICLHWNRKRHRWRHHVQVKEARWASKQV